MQFLWAVRAAMRYFGKRLDQKKHGHVLWPRLRNSVLTARRTFKRFVNWFRPKAVAPRATTRKDMRYRKSRRQASSSNKSVMAQDSTGNHKTISRFSRLNLETGGQNVATSAACEEETLLFVNMDAEEAHHFITCGCRHWGHRHSCRDA